MKIRIAILILGLLTGFSCKKEHKETVINGVVKDFITGQPLSGVNVYLQTWKKEDAAHINNSLQTFQSFITDAEGKFHTEFRALKDHVYGLEYQKPSECYYDYDLPNSNIDHGKTNDIEAKLHSYGQLQIHIKNVSPYDSNDRFCYVLNKTATACLTTPDVGMTVDYYADYEVQAHQWVYIKSFIKKNGVSTTRLDSVQIGICANQTFDLFY